jgi:hypothetical protein
MFPPGAGVALYRQLLFNATARAAWIEQTVAGIDAQVGLYPIVTLRIQLNHFTPGFLSYSVAVFLK